MMMASHMSTVTGSGSQTGAIPKEPMTQETTSLNQISGLLMQMNNQMNQQSDQVNQQSWNRTTSWNTGSFTGDSEETSANSSTVG